MATKEVDSPVEEPATEFDSVLLSQRDELQRQHDGLYQLLRELIKTTPRAQQGQDYIAARTEIIHQITEITVELCRVKSRLCELGRAALIT
jgi:hypothetical protein